MTTTLPDDDPIRALILRLSRPHKSGGRVIERAAVVASGQHAAAILSWITANDGQPEALAPISGQGLHGVGSGGGTDARRPLRYVLSAESLGAGDPAR